MTNETRVGLIDHIGLDLWQAANSWKQHLTDEMVARGYAWYAGAPGAVTMHIGPNGINQSKLQANLLMSKQAVQQLLDKLENDGVIERVPDPKDKRAKIVRFTKVGLQAFAAANQIKRDIEEKYRTLLGEKEFENLRKSLRKIANAE